MECDWIPPCNTTSCFYHKIAATYISIPLISFGVVGNTLCIMIWKKLMNQAKKRNITCGIYLITIAIVDTCMLLSNFFYDSMIYIADNLVTSPSYNTLYAYVFYPAFMFFTFLSFLLVAGVDTCRLTMVLFPFKMRQAATRVTNTAIATIIFVCFAVNVPNFLALKTAQVNGTSCVIATDLYKTEPYFRYRFYFQCVMLSVIPWIIIVVVNLIMIAKKIMEQNFDLHKPGKEMGRILEIVSFWFVFTIFFQCVSQCFFINAVKTDSNYEQVNQVFAFGKTGMVLNSSLKSVLYFIGSKTFRKTLYHQMKSASSIYGSVKKQSKYPSFRAFFARQKPIKKNRRKCITNKGSINAVAPALNPSFEISSHNTPSFCFKQYRDPSAIQLTF